LPTNATTFGRGGGRIEKARRLPRSRRRSPGGLRGCDGSHRSPSLDPPCSLRLLPLVPHTGVARVKPTPSDETRCGRTDRRHVPRLSPDRTRSDLAGRAPCRPPIHTRTGRRGAWTVAHTALAAHRGRQDLSRRSTAARRLAARCRGRWS
jgi:hypothetical protein